MTLAIPNTAELELAERRQKILDFEAALNQVPGVLHGDPAAPLNHLFADGIYVRQIFLPAGTVATGAVHKRSHPSFILTGEVKVFTEQGGAEHYIAPKCLISPAGCKRVVVALQDTIWCTVHLNPEELRDPEALRKYNVAETYEEYEQYRLEQ